MPAKPKKAKVKAKAKAAEEAAPEKETELDRLWSKLDNQGLHLKECGAGTCCPCQGSLMLFKRLIYKKLHVLTGGNCLFHSFGDQIRGRKAGFHEQLRHDTVEYIRENKSRFMSFMEDGVSFDDYVASMMQVNLLCAVSCHTYYNFRVPRSNS